MNHELNTVPNLDIAKQDNINSSDQAIPPALACTLESGYLIEASAGTGKTWTLTGIILRLLIEKKYSPERIIATTFTRAAAAEMQERVADRISDFYGLMRYVKSMQRVSPEWFLPFSQKAVDDATKTAQDSYIDVICQAADQAGMLGSDLINRHLLSYLLTSDSQSVDIIDETLYRLSTLMSSLDKLFVGTLDSLAQKWLNEFAAQIGHDISSEIIDDSQHVEDMVHDLLRAEEARLKHSNPPLYTIIKERYDTLFADAAAMMADIRVSLQFFNAPIDDIGEPPADLAVLTRQLDALIAADLTAFSLYFDEEFCKSIPLSMRTGCMAKSLAYIPKLLTAMQDEGLVFGRILGSAHNTLANNLRNPADAKHFTAKTSDDKKQQFIDLPWQQLSDWLDAVFQLAHDYNWLIDGYVYKLRRDIALAVRAELPRRLERLGKTTFNLQMQRLNQALKANPALAQHIRHHYPVALIDESQDINGAQVELICHVYLNAYRAHAEALHQFNKLGAAGEGIKPPQAPKGFLLLVGDPKQAIYRFRGGDVANYNLVKHYGLDRLDTPVLNSSLTLTENRRSNQALISALNTWFEGNQHQNDHTNHANLGKDIYYQQISAHQTAQASSWQQATANLPAYLGHRPVAVLHLDYAHKADKSRQLALHINSLIQDGHTLNGQPILPKDIAVLARAKSDLVKLKAALDALKIPSVAATEQNLFATPAGEDIYALMMAILHPNHTEHLARFLVSGLVGLTLQETLTVLGETDDANQTDDSHHGLGTQQKLALSLFLKRLYDTWQRHNLSAALTEMLAHAPINTKPSLWLQAAAQGERYLGDLSQLLALIGEQSQLHTQKMLAWYQAQMMADAQSLPDTHLRAPLPSDVGVSLMTIHKSKGLEFPIVYVLGLDSAPSQIKKPAMYPYSDDKYMRYLSVVAIDAQTGEDYAQLDQIETVDELRRLGYVALTRASEQVYVVACDAGNGTGDANKPLAQWCNGIEKGVFSPAARLSDSIDWIALYDHADIDAEPVTDLDLNQKPMQPKAIDMTPLTLPDWADVMSVTQFKGQHKTSFTALIRKLDTNSLNNLNEAVLDDEIVLLAAPDARADNLDVTPADAIPDIRASFIKGAAAGEFLHKVLEQLWRDDEISALIDHWVLRLGLPITLASIDAQQQYARRQDIMMDMPLMDGGQHEALCAWLLDIHHARLAASNRSLASLNKQSQARELGFTLGLSQGFSIGELNAAFSQYSDKVVTLDHDDDRWYQYLRGEIDLVYEVDGRFFIVDYKSNYLGGSTSDYHPDALTAAMDKAGYWLQAAIYQVALHRLLQVRLADYTGNEAKYLGGVEYLFIRGVTAKDTPNESMMYGRLVWQPPLALVLALDRLFAGLPSASLNDSIV